jgi:hypothetical protein
MFEELRYQFPIIYWAEFQLKFLKRKIIFDWQSDKNYVEKIFKIKQGYTLNLKEPKSLNEKLQWLKLNVRKDFHTICADKFRSREYLRKYFSEDYFIPILFDTNNSKDLRLENLPEEPFVLKTNHDAGHFIIVRNKTSIDWGKVRLDFKYYLKRNYFFIEREWQYKNIKPWIIAEKLLVCSNGKIPNDYKVHCINGKVEFIYVAAEREGENKRNIYNKHWEPLFFTWAPKNKNLKDLRGSELDAPKSLKRMIEFSEIIAKDFPYYVRVDFYDVDGRLFFGEITQHHGGGFDRIIPFEFDLKYGELLKLPNDSSSN